MALSIGPVTLVEGEDGPQDLPRVLTVTGAAVDLSDGRSFFQDTGFTEGPIVLTGILENTDRGTGVAKSALLESLCTSRQRVVMRYRAQRWTGLVIAYKPAEKAADRVPYSLTFHVESNGAATTTSPTSTTRTKTSHALDRINALAASAGAASTAANAATQTVRRQAGR